ncbi:hypothetical protein D3C85_1683250 [compost metagenome]
MRQTRGELVDSEDPHAPRGQPESQWRLAPERHAIGEPQGDPIAAHRHLSRDLSIAPLGGVHQRIARQRGQTQHDEENEDASSRRAQRLPGVIKKAPHQ